MKYSVIILLIISFALSCTTQKVKQADTPAERLLYSSHEAHGGRSYQNTPFSFTFRKKRYSFLFDKKGGYTYTVDYEKDGKNIHDELTNEQFSRRINGQAVELTEKDIRRGSSGLNSVIYFATLPHKLLDPAVNTTKMPDARIKDKDYEVLKVTFDQEGGGADHDDTYYYWINKADHKIDYLAYDFHVGKGGVRFRAAYNRRTVDGVTFQDYINYKAPKNTSLDQLPSLYEQGKLDELSRIDTKDVRSKG